MPTRKVSVGAVSGALVVLILLGISLFAPSVADKINPAAASAGTVLVSTILAYLIPEADQQP